MINIKVKINDKTFFFIIILLLKIYLQENYSIKKSDKGVQIVHKYMKILALTEVISICYTLAGRVVYAKR